MAIFLAFEKIPPILPKDYIKLSFIDVTSSGIKLGIYDKGNERIESKIEFTSEGSDYSFIRLKKDGTGVKSLRFMSNKVLNLQYSTDAFASGNNSNVCELNTPYKLEIQFKNGDSYLKIDDNKVVSNNYTIPNLNLEYRLFNYNNSGTDWGWFTGRCYYFKMWQNDILVKDLIPCKRKSDGKIGFYDMVSNTFLYSYTSADIIAGTEKNDYKEISDIQYGEPIENFSPFSDIKNYSSTNHYYMSCSYPTETLSLIRLTKVIVESSTRRSGGDSYVEFSIITNKGTKLSKHNMISEGTLIENGTLDGIEYKLTGQGGNDLGRYTVEFNKPIELSSITGGCGSGVGQWRDTDRMKITVNGEKIDEKKPRITTVILDNKIIYGGWKYVSNTYTFPRQANAYLESPVYDFKFNTGVKITLKTTRGLDTNVNNANYQLAYSDNGINWTRVKMKSEVDEYSNLSIDNCNDDDITSPTTYGGVKHQWSTNEKASLTYYQKHRYWKVFCATRNNSGDDGFILETVKKA